MAMGRGEGRGFGAGRFADEASGLGPGIGRGWPGPGPGLALGGFGVGRGIGPGGGRRRRGLVEPAVLAALAGRSAHGYDLRRAVEEITGDIVVVDPGSLYRLLRQLEQVGAVESVWSDGEFGPQRRDYHLTERGRALLASWRDDLARRDLAFHSVIAEIDKALGPQAPKSADGTAAPSTKAERARQGPD